MQQPATSTMVGTGVRIGIDMGGTKCSGVGISDNGEILAEAWAPTPVGGNAVIDTLVNVVEQVRGHESVRDRTIRSVGVGVPGLVTSDGAMRFAPHLFGMVEAPVKQRLIERLGISAVQVENDNTAATWGERTLGAARGFDNVLYVGLGTGIGGGIILGGNLIRGQSGFAGEIGHMTVDQHGERCVCGRNGCWELYASGSGLARLAGRNGEVVTEGARNGDPRALEVLGRFSSSVALGLANLTVAIDPGCIVLGGGVMDPPEPLLSMIRDRLADAMGDAKGHRDLPELRSAELGKRAGAIGAALLAS